MVAYVPIDENRRQGQDLKRMYKNMKDKVAFLVLPVPIDKSLTQCRSFL